VAFPNITYGKNPWLPSTTRELPKRVSDIRCLEAEIDIAQTGTSKGNLSFDLWITQNSNSEPADITDEVMIWLSTDGFTPAGSRIDTLIIDGQEVGFWVKEEHRPSEDYQWRFLAFKYESDFHKGSIQLHQFLDFLLAGGYLSPDAYLASVELGNEIVSGHGQTLVKDYRVHSCEKNKK
jgi:hypothetical protein